MRPLALPNTIIRIISGILYVHLQEHVSPRLSPTQALVSTDREAISLFAKAQAFLDSGTAGNKALVTSVDLSKAFERVSIDWILLVLAAHGVPYWVLCAVIYLTTARRSRLKVGRTLVQWICLLAGVDMGSGVSPWLFCLTLDPLLRQLEALGLTYLGAYIDDLSFGARWPQREPVQLSLLHIFSCRPTYARLARWGGVGG